MMTDFNKPRLSASYSTRCSKCETIPIHKSNTSGLCTDCAVHLRCIGQYEEYTSSHEKQKTGKE